MRYSRGLLALAIGLALSPAAWAQPGSKSDQAYCAALAEKYTYWLGHDVSTPDPWTQRGGLEGQFAVTQCKQGNTAATIAFLEKKLTDAKFTLPSRD